MIDFQDLLKGGDLRSLGKANEIIALVNNQTDFDKLFAGLNHSDRRVVMRTADAIEKITLHHKEYLQKHKQELLTLCHTAGEKELKWHLALLVPRLDLTKKEFGSVWHLLTQWAINKKESKIVRVNSIQGLFSLLQTNQELLQDYQLTVSEIEKENIPSINARIKKLKKMASR